MRFFNGWWICDAYTLTFDDYIWCTEQFGAPSPNKMWFFSNEKFYFKNEADAMWYTLRWIGER